jgi:hypothetical protein
MFMKQEQIEMGFFGNHHTRPTVRRNRRLRRAHWWFRQMRQVVECALARHTAPMPRPEQIHLALPNGRPSCEPRPLLGELN